MTTSKRMHMKDRTAGLVMMAHVLVVTAMAPALGVGAALGPAPRVVGHRGLLRHAQENTLASFRACLDLPSASS